MQKYANLVELGKCCQTHICLQNSVSIQPRTRPPKTCKFKSKKQLQNFSKFAHKPYGGTTAQCELWLPSAAGRGFLVRARPRTRGPRSAARSARLFSGTCRAFHVRKIQDCRFRFCSLSFRSFRRSQTTRARLPGRHAQGG